MDLVKRYFELINKKNPIKIKTSKAQYLKSIFKNNEEADTWDDLENRVRELENEIKNKPKKIKLVPADTLKNETSTSTKKEHDQHIEELERCKKIGRYDELKKEIFNNATESEKQFLKGRFLDAIVLEEFRKVSCNL